MRQRDGATAAGSQGRPAPAAGIAKRSVTLARHRTSLSLEPVFWELLQQEAQRQALPLAQLVAAIDRARTAEGAAVNLSSAVRVYLVERLRAQVADAAAPAS